jgi:hypothetical protein
VRELTRLFFGTVPGAAGVVGGLLVIITLGFLLTATVVGGLASAGAIDGGREEPGAEPRCVRWYPDFCVPGNRGNLDCDDLGRGSLAVRGADPFDFDEDLDGVGCEPT